VNDFVEFVFFGGSRKRPAEGMIRENPVVCGVDISRTVVRQLAVSTAVVSDNPGELRAIRLRRRKTDN
jgi:hypothetical protein